MRRILVLTTCLAACVARQSEFPCTQSVQCLRGAEQGACEATGFCSFASADCTTGRRYGEGASSELRNACVASTTSGRIGAWSNGPALPNPLWAPATASAANHVYSIGGFDNPNTAVVAAVWTASIRDDGTLGAWTATRPLPGGHRSASAVTANGSLYVLGGRIGAGSAQTAEVWFAPISADGTLGEWAPTRPLPTPTHGFAAVAANDRIYVFGGVHTMNSALVPTDESWVADIGADGQLGPWVATTPLPQRRRALAAVATPGQIYVLGGCEATAAVCNTASARAEVAPILSDGRLGAWTETTPLSGPRWDHGAAVFDGFLYVVGGRSGTTSADRLSKVEASPIQPDGSLGDWVPTTPLPAAHLRPRVVVFGQRIYAFDGRAGDTLVAPLVPR